tara:strand:+ start:155 stop:892 length:738 start_codon:yes stop_codon:yes gene_type:complete
MWPKDRLLRYYLLIIIFFALLFTSSLVWPEGIEPYPGVPQDRFEDTSSQDSAESGDQDGSLNTNNQNSTVNSNNNTTSNSKTFNGAGSSGMPPYSAIAPSYMSTGPETCLQGGSQALQSSVVGLSRGAYREDPECNRRRDAKVLSDLGMKVAAVARMCQNPDTWKAMFMSGTPCPILQSGKLIVGKRAYLALKQNPSLYIPNYKEEESWYNSILGLGDSQGEQTTDDDGRSISERFRSSQSESAR